MQENCMSSNLFSTTVNRKSDVIKMSKEESSPVNIKSEPCNDDVHYINGKIKVEKSFLDEVKPTVDLEYITADMKEESLMEVKQEEIIIKDKISNSCNTQNDFTDDNVIFTADIELSTTSLLMERSTSTRKKRFACTSYQYKTSRKQNLKQHMVHDAGKKPASYANFRCAECEYETIIKNNLVQHMVIHTGERRFACNLCKFKTAWRNCLKSHVMKHTGEKPFACNLCEFKSAQKGDLKNHMMTHTGEKPFSCNLCEFKTAYKRYLNSHMMVHTGEKPFACNLCEFKSAHKSHINRHMKKHTGEKPFFCNLCEFKTAHKSSLKNHMKKHAGEKPFPCNLCEFKTAKKVKTAEEGNIMSHMMKHTSKKLFTCNVCDFKFASKQNLKLHIKTHAGNLYEFKEDIKEYESLIEVKQEEITVKNEIPSRLNCHQHSSTHR